MDECKKSQIKHEFYQTLQIKDKNRYKKRFRLLLDKHESEPLVRKTLKKYYKCRNSLNEELKIKCLPNWKRKQRKLLESKARKIDRRTRKKYTLASGINLPINLVYYRNRLRAYG